MGVVCKYICFSLYCSFCLRFYLLYPVYTVAGKHSAANNLTRLSFRKLVSNPLKASLLIEVGHYANLFAYSYI